jgi:threonyl-tRNA synthetase
MERSFRDLPIRFADFGVLHRNEVSGALSGLTRVRRFQQDDAHIFCSRDQIQSEITKCLEFVDHVYGIFKFRYEILLSTRPENYLGELKEWNEAEDALRNSINSIGRPFKTNEGDGAFYGPKIDIILYDALGRKSQCATIQLDFQLPQRFNLKYTGSDGALHTPVIVHRAILGSLERLIGILLENYGKKLPFWLTPRQIAIVPLFAEEHALKIKEALVDFEVKIIEDKGLTLNKKIRNAEIAGYRLVCVVGRKEAEDNEINVRFENGNKNMKVDEFISFIKDLVSKKGDLNEFALNLDKCNLN